MGIPNIITANLRAVNPQVTIEERAGDRTLQAAFELRFNEHTVLGKRKTLVPTLNGVGTHQADLAAGADAIRTWGDTSEPRGSYTSGALAAAEAQGVMISAGLTLPNKVPFYADCGEDQFTGNGSFAQFKHATLEIVAVNKASPALLWWTLGNEAASMQHVGPQHPEHVCINRVMAWVAAAIKQEDPRHPVGTVVSGIRGPEIGNISYFSALYNHSVEFIGVNAYGDTAPQAGATLRSQALRVTLSPCP